MRWDKASRVEGGWGGHVCVGEHVSGVLRVVADERMASGIVQRDVTCATQTFSFDTFAGSGAHALQCSFEL
jgi:hypothetical protein